MWSIENKQEIEELQEICVKKMVENIDKTKVFIASPSTNDPDYVYHWTRDAALTIRVIIDKYTKTKESKYFQILIKYITCEHELQQLSTQGGLGEPKYNADRSAFNENWGRPQNDGPALRGLAMLQILPFLDDEYASIAKRLVIPMIKNDVDYVSSNLDNHCFDLWEEKDAYHFYTRVVQCKFMKEATLYFFDYPCGYFDDDELLCMNIKFERLKELIKHHYDSFSVISAFDLHGKEKHRHDASIMLALCHINYDEDIIDKNAYFLVDNNVFNLVCYFSDKYENSENRLIGRYMDDRYFDGHTWILCTLGMAQYLLHRRHKYNNFENDENNPHTEDKRDILNNFLNPENIIKSILDIDENLNLAEQYDPNKKLQISAKNLTWNYSELYFALELLRNKN